MGEYILYFRGRIVGGIYDDRLLVRPVPAALALMPDAPHEQPYPGAKEMLLVEGVDNGDFLRDLFRAMYDELPPPKKRAGKKRRRKRQRRIERKKDNGSKKRKDFVRTIQYFAQSKRYLTRLRRSGPTKP